jgi:hypothetical protein
MLAMSFCDVMVAPPTDMPGMEVRLHLPDIHHGLLHIFEWNDQEG